MPIFFEIERWMTFEFHRPHSDMPFSLSDFQCRSVFVNLMVHNRTKVKIIWSFVYSIVWTTEYGYFQARILFYHCRNVECALFPWYCGILCEVCLDFNVGTLICDTATRFGTFMVHRWVEFDLLLVAKLITDYYSTSLQYIKAAKNK